MSKNAKATDAVRSNARIRAVASGFIGILRSAWDAERWCITPGRTLCGQSAAPLTAKNGQSPCMLPSDPYVMTAKLKNTVTKNETRTSGGAIFLSAKDI